MRCAPVRSRDARRTAPSYGVPTPAERRALLFVAAVAVLGTGVRGLRALGGDPVPASDRASLADQIARVDSAIASGGRRPVRTGPRQAEPRTVESTGVEPREKTSAATRSKRGAEMPREPIDLDRADSAALDLLPGIGPALAARIVADRAANGPFGSLEQLQRVKGVGPALAARVAPHVTFSASGRHSPMGPGARGPSSRP
jgi:predicted flap endonuclease-1-like 5' DNA nuclease